MKVIAPKSFKDAWREWGEYLLLDVEMAGSDEAWYKVSRSRRWWDWNRLPPRAEDVFFIAEQVPHKIRRHSAKRSRQRKLLSSDVTLGAARWRHPNFGTISEVLSIAFSEAEGSLGDRDRLIGNHAVAWVPPEVPAERYWWFGVLDEIPREDWFAFEHLMGFPVFFDAGPFRGNDLD